MTSSIAVSLINYAAEGKETALDVAQEYQLALEGMLEIASPDERKAASFLLQNVNRAIEEIVKGTLVEVARQNIQRPVEQEVPIEL